MKNIPWEQLKSQLNGDLLTDNLTRILYSTDASIYQIKPLAVIYPKNADDVVKIVNFARTNNIPIHPRGAGCGMTGGSLGEGIVIDFTKYMNKILFCDKKESVIIEPGVTHTELNTFLVQYNSFFPPDPSSGDYCTLGGMISNNSSGLHSLKYGTTKNYILDLEIVLASGEVINTQKYTSDTLLNVFKKYKDILPLEKPKTEKYSCGYNVFEAYKESSIDYNRLFCSSEGTLGIVTKAKLKIIPLPQKRTTMVAIYNDLEKCIRAITILRETRPSLIELIDHVLINLIKKEKGAAAKLLPDNAQGILLIEYEEDINEARLNEIKSKINADSVIKAQNEEEKDKLWSIRKSASPILNKSEKAIKAIRCIEDVCVPIDKINDFFKKQTDIFKKYGLECSFFGHVGSGNFHLDPHIDTETPNLNELIENLTLDTYELVISLGGVTSGEHGDGILRSPLLYRQFPKTYPLFIEIKKHFDPQNILNPGKIANAGKNITTKDIRYKRQRIKTNTLLDQYPYEIEKCHGCGNCRFFCPVFNAIKEERASSRSKANTLRAFITNELNSKDLINSKIFDLCISCHNCSILCPTKIDIPKIITFAKSHINDVKGISLRDKILQNTPLISKLGNRFSFIFTLLNKFKILRKFLSYFSSLSPEIKFPKYEIFDFKSAINIPKSTLRNPQSKVIYFPGCFGLYNEPFSETKSTFNLLNKLGVNVKYCDFNCCRVSSITKGDLKTAAKYALKNAKLLKSEIAAGYDIVTSQASCGFSLKKEYSLLIQEEDFKLISEHVHDINEYLLKLLNTKSISFKPLNYKVVFHYPCHLKIQDIGNAPQDILKKVPNLKILATTTNCCGMAGTFGLKKENFNLAKSIGARTFSTIKEANPDFVITTCGSCKMQIEQHTNIKVRHLCDLLNESL